MPVRRGGRGVRIEIFAKSFGGEHPEFRTPHLGWPAGILGVPHGAKYRFFTWFRGVPPKLWVPHVLSQGAIHRNRPHSSNTKYPPIYPILTTILPFFFFPAPPPYQPAFSPLYITSFTPNSTLQPMPFNIHFFLTSHTTNFEAAKHTHLAT